MIIFGRAFAGKARRSGAVLRRRRNEKIPFKRGDYATALRLWQPLAQQGNTKAQTGLGGYYFAIGGDRALALKWYLQAANQGDGGAQYMVGILLDSEAFAKRVLRGEEASDESTEAMKWFRKAADQGVAGAQKSLGDRYRQLEQYEQAAEWYRKAAEQGNVAAQGSLADIYGAQRYCTSQGPAKSVFPGIGRRRLAGTGRPPSRVTTLPLWSLAQSIGKVVAFRRIFPRQQLGTGWRLKRRLS